MFSKNIPTDASTLYLNDKGSPVDTLSNDRLGFTFCLALALHAAFILGITFNLEDLRNSAPKLEITLAQFQSSKAPEEADFLAQSSQQGSGTLEEATMMTTRELAEFQDNAIHDIAEQPKLTASELQLAQEAVVTTTANSDHNHQYKKTVNEELPSDQPQIDEKHFIDRSQEIASLKAKLDRQQYAFAKRPRIRRLTSVATKQSEDALYLHNWRTKIEMIGNQNYPERAKSNSIYGDLRLVVSLLPNGDVHKVRILKSSGHNILDQAAIKIVHLAAPYDPFPAAMSRDTDVLEIIRTWRFEHGSLTSRS